MSRLNDEHSKDDFDSMDAIKRQLDLIAGQIIEMNENIEAIRPLKPRFRIVSSSRLKAERTLTEKNATDALNHAAAFIGYFEGIPARGAFQKRTKAIQHRNTSRTVFDVLEYVRWVLSQILAVVCTYRDRTPLVLFPGGQKKPGPMRTAQLCRGHLSRLDTMVGALAYRSAPNDEAKARVLQRYEP
ncbi:MAG: hypothetical protein CMH52_14230 [Myxococcales bacterium]|nr:hypothetical protein [Myxococcales bacterium]